MSVVIRLMRAGAKKRPFYRVVVADSRRQRDGRFIEILGYYDPMVQPHKLSIEKDRVVDWISKGARPSEQAASLLRTQGIQLTNASKSTKKKAAKPAAGAKAAKKKVARKPRAASTRKVKAKTARKTGVKKVAKKKAKKS